MPDIEIITTPGAANANSYVSVDEYEIYKGMNSVDLVAQDDPEKTVRCLVIAANRLNRENWLGQQATTTQRLKWPRLDVEKPDQPGGYGGWAGYGGWTGYGGGGYGRVVYESDEIPQLVKDAQCALAMEIEQGFVEGGNGEDVEEFQADNVRVKFRDSRPIGGLPSEAQRLIQDLVAGNILVRA